MIIMPICYFYSVATLTYAYFGYEATLHVVDILVLLVTPVITLGAFVISDNYSFVRSKTKRLTAKLHIRGIWFLYVIGILFFLLSYLYLYLEIFIDESPRLSLSTSLQLAAFISFFASTSIGVKEASENN